MKKINLFMVINLMFILLLTGCTSANHGSVDNNKEQGGQNIVGKYRRIDAKQAKKMIDEDKNIIVLDVRTPEEYSQKHIPGTVLIPNEAIDTNIVKELPKDKTILIYCRSGNRSRQATEKLLKLGYNDIYDFGGINEWIYETENGDYKR